MGGRPKSSWFIRSVLRALRWLDKRTPPPYHTDYLRRDQDWDYGEADRQAWDSEPDKEALSQALTLLRSDPEAAIAPLTKLADGNSPRAMNALGEIYYWRLEDKVDKEVGEAWFKKASEHGSWRGQL